MKNSFDNYERLAGWALGMSSLWQGVDHLVYVRGTGFILPFTEEYRRYRYQDIQSLSVMPTSRAWLMVLYILGILVSGAASAGLIYMVNESGANPVSLFFLSAFIGATVLFLLLLIRHIILGPTCRCHIQTNVKREVIKPLNRIHKANQAIDQIGLLVRESQKGLEAGDQNQEGEVASSPAVREEEPKLKISGLVIPTFGIFAVFSLIILAALHMESVLLNGIGLVILVTGSSAVFASLIASVRHPAPESVRNCLWILLALEFIFGGAAAVYLVLTVTNYPEYTMDITGPLEAFTVVAATGGLGFYLGFLFLILGIFSVALIGILQALKWKKRIQATSVQSEEIAATEPPKGVGDE